jgi:hypothetical protein
MEQITKHITIPKSREAVVPLETVVCFGFFDVVCEVTDAVAVPKVVVIVLVTPVGIFESSMEMITICPKITLISYKIKIKRKVAIFILDGFRM